MTIPKRTRGIETRKKIIATATKLFGKYGYHGADPKTIAEKASCATGSIYAYFESKEELFIALMAVREETRVAGFKAIAEKYGVSAFKTKSVASVLADFVTEVVELHSPGADFDAQAFSLANEAKAVGAAYRKENKAYFDLLKSVLVAAGASGASLKEAESALVPAFRAVIWELSPQGAKAKPAIKVFANMLAGLC